MARVAALIAADTPYVGIGTGTATPAASDTQLGTETARAAAASAVAAGVQADIRGFFPNSVAPTTIEEVGLFLNASGTANSGDMLVRGTVTFAKGSADVLVSIKVSIVQG